MIKIILIDQANSLATFRVIIDINKSRERHSQDKHAELLDSYKIIIKNISTEVILFTIINLIKIIFIIASILKEITVED